VHIKYTQLFVKTAGVLTTTDPR